MDRIFYLDESLTEKSGVPQGSDLPDVYFELLEFDLKSLFKDYGLTIQDIEWTAADGVTTDLEQAKSDKDKKAQIQQLKQQRDESLNSNTVTINGHEFNARPKDLSNIELGIEKGDTLWPDVNDFMVDVTVADLTTLLNTGISQGEAIWDTYKQAVKDLQ